jgi:hypothetical protein
MVLARVKVSVILLLVERRRWITITSDTLVRLAFEDEEDVSFVSPSVYDAPCAALGGSVAGAQGAF